MTKRKPEIDVLHIRLAPKLKRLAVARAKATNRDLSKLIRHLLEQECEKADSQSAPT